MYFDILLPPILCFLVSIYIYNKAPKHQWLGLLVAIIISVFGGFIFVNSSNGSTFDEKLYGLTRGEGGMGIFIYILPSVIVGAICTMIFYILSRCNKNKDAP